MTDLANVQKKKKQKVNVAGYLFILPAMFFFCLYILYPIFFIIKNSLFKWATLSNMEFVGLNNFLNVFKDSTFWITMKNSILWILVTVPVQAILGFFLAYAWKVIFKNFLPYLIFHTGSYLCNCCCYYVQ